MTRPTFSARRAAAIAAAGLATAGLSAVATSAPAQAAGSVPVDKSYAYTCNLNVDGTPVPNQAVGVRTQTSVPSSVTPGEVIPPTPVTITLTMPESLRAFTYNIVEGRQADGSSSDSAVTVASNGASQVVTFTVAAPKTDIPATTNTPWIIPATGTVPSITTPASAAGIVTLAMPQHFTVNATVYRDDTVPATMDCTTAADLSLASIAVAAPAPANVAPAFAKSAYKVKAKKNKAVVVKAKATDANGDAITYKASKTSKGKVIVKGAKVTFKPKKNFKGKTSFWLTATDSKGASARTKVTVTVK